MGGKLPSTADRRVQRTRRALRDAMVTLIVERGWDGFGVQELCDRADVARSTFYTHFADKEELVGGSFDDLRRGIRAQLQEEVENRGRPLGFARALIQHGHEQRRLFLAIVGKRSGLFVQRRFRQVVLELVAEDLAALLPAGPRRDAVVAFVAGAFLELLTWSLEVKAPPSPDEVDALFHELTAPVLAQAAPGAERGSRPAAPSPPVEEREKGRGR
jgi:AcrR family transcriptional regulator